MMRGAGARSQGFTLIEAVMVLVITGIIGAMVAAFIRAPVQGYLDTSRRAQLADTADTALRRITRELRQALPNSVRVSNVGGRFYLEMLTTTGGGRYRAAPTAAGSGDTLDFTQADGSFDVLGTPPAFAAGQFVVVTNLGPGSGADAYAGDNRSTWTGLAGNTLSIAAKQFPVASPANRFQIIDAAVSFECDPAAGVLRRYWGYVISAAQPTPPTGGSDALLATQVSACFFGYDSAVAATRTGLVSLRIELSSGGETVVLFQQAHVGNAP